ncbi:multiple sugar transport system substrate-binding protein [Variovorax sp. 54]|uniref:ABC transporter substrate-binding protein n=1 Tax=Variovorax sp. 54 TaxID=2035212 RepID=UPI000C5BE42F|nr:sugar ABC transporter substrate-binding protein [Variovorax sp. 54]PIF76252.1 multiple sugar transport system substrate-binding protein [Variovorax sp. 54]
MFIRSEVVRAWRRMLLAACLTGGAAVAQAQMCKEDVRVLAQERDGLALLEKHKDEFKARSGASFKVDTALNENDRRTRTRADASGAGRYHVYYVDEANVALFAQSKWITPLLKYYPAEYDYADFDPGRQKVAAYAGETWFAPLTGGGDLLVYRKDLLEKAGIAPPATLDEFVAAARKLHDPAKGIYGVALRGQRGSGANVWRWMPYFRGLGGQWFEGGKPVFNSPAAVKATQTYLELFKYSPPSTKTGGWDESTDAFLMGKVAMLIESTPLAGYAHDPKKSLLVINKVAYAPPPTPLTGGGYGHGLAIGAKANKSEEARQCAGLFIAWATSKVQEQRRLAEGQFGELNRSSVLASPEFARRYGVDLGKALADTGKRTAVNFWQDPAWPDLGDRWGVILEELINGSRTDIQGGLNELEAYAKQLLDKRGR